MIIIPTGTDAPIYHWPYVTIAMMILNVALFFAIPPWSSDPVMDQNDLIVEQGETKFERYALTLGNGLHPVQWLTHNFLHNGFMHLAGNLVFLWAFGIVVEGKLGAVKYLVTYLTIGVLHGASVQILLLRSGLDNHAVGASAVIYGLLAACMIWAPRNELSCTIILPLLYRAFVFHREFYYTTVALFFVGEQLFGLIFWGGLAGQIMITEMGHLSGATWGSLIAVLLLKTGLVDCEGWDAFTLWAKWRKLGRDWKARGDRLDRQKVSEDASIRASLRSQKKGARKAEVVEPDPEQRAASALKKMMGLIEKGEIDAALIAYDRSAKVLPYWPSQPDLYAIIKAFHAQGAVVESLHAMRDHCRRFPATSDKMRLKLAQILIRDRQRPIAALRVLEEILPGTLSPDLERSRQILIRQAVQMQEQGVLEVEGDD